MLAVLAVVAVAVLAGAWAAGRDDGGERPAAVRSLEGWRGTVARPAQDTEAVAALHERLREQDPELTGLLHAAEAYDATVLVALAAAVAETDGSALAARIPEVSAGGEPCTGYEACLALVEDGADLDYVGVSGPADLRADGELRAGTFDVVELGADDRIDPDRTSTTVVESGSEDEPAPPEVQVERPGEGTLHVGTLLPLTGTAAAVGAATEAAVRLAVADIDAAGGFGGEPVTLTTADAADVDGPDAAAIGDLLTAEVDVVIGPVASAAAVAAVDPLVNAGVVLVSPSATAEELGGDDDGGLFLRLAPSDRLQGRALAGLVLDEGHDRIALAVRDDPYGNGLAATVAAALEEGGAEVVVRSAYAPGASSFARVADALVAAEADALVVLGGEEAAGLAHALITRGAGPGRLAWYGSDRAVSDATGEAFAAGT